jgi:hypothetical protein
LRRPGGRRFFFGLSLSLWPSSDHSRCPESRKYDWMMRFSSSENLSTGDDAGSSAPSQDCHHGLSASA